MAEINPTGASTQPSGSTTGASQTPAPQDATDYRALYEKTQAEFQRESQRARGLQPFVEKARQVGFDRPEAFDEYSQFAQALKKRGLTLAQAKALFDAGSSDPEQGQAQGGDEDVRAQIAELRQWKEAAEAEALERAFAEHEREEKAEAERLEAQLKGIYGDDPHTPAYLAMGREEWRKARESAFYDKGHRLAEYRNKTLGEDGIGKIVAAHKDAVAKRAGAALDGLGKKARAAGQNATSTVAGANSGKGDVPKGEQQAGTVAQQLEAEVSKAFAGISG